MDIAYMKYCLPIDVGGKGKPRGGSDSRRGLFGNLAEFGHTVDIFSDIQGDPKDHKYGSVFPDDDPDSDKYDLLMIEDGPTNVMFSGKDDVPFLLKTYRKIDRWEGKIVYLHQDNLLYMIINLDAFSPTWSKISHGYGTEDLLKNREFYIFTFANDIGTLREWTLSLKRSGYQYVSGIYSIPPPRARWMKPIDTERRNFLFYAGNERGRKQKFTEYYGHGRCSVRVAGKWGKKYHEQFPRIKWLGQIPQEEVFDKLNESVATIAIGDKAYERFDSLVPRMYEAVQSGCILFLDSPHKTAGRIFGEEFLISSVDDFFDKVPRLKNKKARKAMVELQRRRAFIDHESFVAFGRRFEEICEEIGVI